jgi:PTS system nitrogen regulatory IIA component
MDDMGVAKLRQRDFLMSAFARFIFPENILLDVDAADKAQVFAHIAFAFRREHKIDYATVYEALQAREKLESTALGCGVALPHAQISGLSAPMIGILRIRTPVAFDAPDGLPVSTIVVLLVPSKGAREYLQILAEIADALCDEGFREKLDAAPDPHAAWQLMVRWGTSHVH